MTNLTLPMSIWVGHLALAILYGVNTVIYPISMIILLSRRRWSTHKNKKLVVATSFLYLLATLQFWLTMVASYLATFDDYDVLTEAPENRAADICAAVTIFVGDLVLMHRLWVLYGRRNYIVVLPLIASIFALLGYIAASYLWARYGADSSFPSTSAVIAYVTSFGLSSAANMSVTGLIITRIWWMSRGMRKTFNGVSIIPKDTFSTVRTAIEVLVESGLLMTIAQLILTLCYARHSVGFPIAQWMAAQIYAFAPMLVIVRVGLMGPSTHAASGTGPISTIRFGPESDEDEEPHSQTPLELSAVAGPQTVDKFDIRVGTSTSKTGAVEL